MVILGLTVDNISTLDTHMKKMCKKSVQKLNTHSRIPDF